MQKNKLNAFTMVELAIVVVIIGILISAVLGGQTLIENSKRMNFISNMADYKSALEQFKDKYYGIPGDLSNAQDFFGALATSNGDGNGTIARTTEELFAWQHLALAKFIKGSFSGTTSGSSGTIVALEDDIPVAPFRNAGYRFYTDDHKIQYLVHSVQTGAYDGSSNYDSPFISPLEAYAIDLKIDDGNPSRGEFIAEDGRDADVGSCWGDNSTPSDDTDDTYVSISDTKNCMTIYYLEPVTD